MLKSCPFSESQPNSVALFWPSGSIVCLCPPSLPAPWSYCTHRSTVALK